MEEALGQAEVITPRPQVRAGAGPVQWSGPPDTHLLALLPPWPPPLPFPLLRSHLTARPATCCPDTGSLARLESSAPACVPFLL